MSDARSAAQPSSKPRSPLGQRSKRLSKWACMRTAQPAGPNPCWSSRSEGARGSGIFKGCQRLLSKGVLSVWLQGEVPPIPTLACLEGFSANNGRRQALRGEALNNPSANCRHIGSRRAAFRQPRGPFGPRHCGSGINPIDASLFRPYAATNEARLLPVLIPHSRSWAGMSQCGNLISKLFPYPP